MKLVKGTIVPQIYSKGTSVPIKSSSKTDFYENALKGPKSLTS